MAFLSDTTYNKLAKNSEESRVVFLNQEGEFVNSGPIISLKKTKSKIKTRWETVASKNVFPFTYASLIIQGRSVLMSSIKPIEYTSNGYMDLEYEGES